MTGMSDRSDMPDQADVTGPSVLTELSASEAAEVLGVAERSVRRYIARGKLPARRVLTDRGVQEYRISRAAVTAFQGQRAALEHDETPAADRMDMPAVQDGPQGAVLALQAELASYRQELAAARLERERLEAEREHLAAERGHLQATIASKDATIERQAEELGALRERLRSVDHLAQTQAMPATAPPPRPPAPGLLRRALRWWRRP